MSLDASVVLVGLSGTGKSTVAEWVASRAGLPARDLDSLVEDDAGASVARLFDSSSRPCVGFWPDPRR